MDQIQDIQDDFSRLPVDRFQPYQGKDPSLVEDPHCFKCFEKPFSPLLRCSRCKIAWYCGSKCQKAHYKSIHGEVCKQVACMIERVEELEIPLRAVATLDLSFNMQIENLFETQVGCFWGLTETRKYLCARQSLSEVYWILTYGHEVKEIYEKALFHNLELMRLCIGDDLDARYHTPFILLNLNRDDDAYTFIRYWMRLHSGERIQEEEIRKRHSQSCEGDWIYPRETNCRYRDIFDEIPHYDERFHSLAFLMALAIIKLRIVAAHDAASRSVDLALQTSYGPSIHEVRSQLIEMLVGCNVHVEDQRRQVKRLFDLIHQNNPSMLPSILNPRPMKVQPPPESRSIGHPSEVYEVLKNCHRGFVRVPGGVEMLVQRFGKKPTYDANMDIKHRVSKR